MPWTFFRKRKRAAAAVDVSQLAVPWAIVPDVLAELVAAAPRLRADDDPVDVIDDPETPGTDPARIGSTAIIPIHGVLAPQVPWWYVGTSTEQAAADFRRAMADPEITQIVLRVNSPGGLVHGTQELSDLILSARGKKDVVAFVVNGYGASAAFWIASAAGKLYATPSSQIGSVGVITAHVDASEAEKAMGLKVTVFAKPPAKAIGNGHEPLTAEDRKAIEAEIAPLYEQFVAALARNRGVSAERVQSDFGGGAVLLAADAAAAGMIDGVRDWNQFLQTLGAAPAASRSTPKSNPFAPGSALPVGSRENEEIEQGGLIVKYSQKTLALLVAAGVIEDIAAPEAALNAAVKAWFAAHGKAVPETEEAIAAAVKASLGQVHNPVADPPGTPAVDVNAAVQAALAADRTRRGDILARASLLNVAADAPELLAALDNGTTPAAFAETVLSKAVAENRPVRQQLEAGPAEADKFHAAAVDALLLRSSHSLAAIGRQEKGFDVAGQIRKSITENAAVREVCGMSWADIVRRSVELAGVRLRDRSPLGYAQAALALVGQTKHLFAEGHPTIVGAFGLAMQGPGDYPSLFDGVSNKIVQFALQIAPVTYTAWCGRISDLADFNPRSVSTFGNFGELPLHVDGRPYEQSTLPSEAAWVQADTYGDEFVLTPRMLLADPMDFWIRALASKQIAHERTLNRLCVDLLTGNVTAPADGVACYSHSNDVNNDGGPGITGFTAVRKKINQQKLVGQVEEAGLDLAVVITGSEWLTDAQVATWAVPGTNYQPATLSAINPFTYLRPVYDPMVSSASDDGKTWYGAVDPLLLPGIVFGFVQGYGPGGRRESYYDPSTGGVHYKVEGAFGAALLHAEALCRADGASAT